MCNRTRLKLVFSIPPHRPILNIAPGWNVAPPDPLPIAEEALNWHRLLATLLLILALGACTQVTGQGQAPYAPYPHDDREMSDRGPDM